MQTVKTTLTTEAIFSDDGAKRYLLRKTWNDSKPILSIIMLAPSSAGGIELDSSTQLVLNNAFRLGFGSVDILNLFSTLNDFALKEAEDEDTDNLNAIRLDWPGQNWAKTSSHKKSGCNRGKTPFWRR